MNIDEQIRFGQCCQKCGRPKLSCVCIQQIIVKKNDCGIDAEGNAELLKQKIYSRDQVKQLLEKLRIKLGLYQLYDRSYPDKWIEEYL